MTLPPVKLFSFLVPAAMLVAACSRQTPQVLTPVRVIAPAPDRAVGADTVGSDTDRVADAQSDDPFAPLSRNDEPGPSLYRSASGAPGPEYWQQRADYAIAATLDTAAHAVSGTVTIRYTNNSPDSLRFVWLQVEQNLYREGSKGSTVFPGESRFGVRDFRGGFDIDELRVDGKSAAARVDDTMMRIDLPAPLRPGGGVASISMRYTFVVPERGSDRMGRDSALYEIAQWYPRMAVYDDVSGWNTDPYLGQGEFYLEYGTFDYAITAPAGYVVAGTGVLQNPREVLSEPQRARLARALRSPDVVAIIPAAEARAAPAAGTRTWRFRAENVRDVAWAGAPDFRWDAASWNGVLAQAFYSWPKAGRQWEQAAENTRNSIRTYSELFYPYPYPRATAVAGVVSGMEYPMFAMNGYGNPNDPDDAWRTNDHEQAHQWFPMLVGSNERRYFWMDEGLTQYMNLFANERRYQHRAPPPGAYLWPYYMASWRLSVAQGVNVPSMTLSDRIPTSELGTTAYFRPAAALLALRNTVVGRETFDRALHEYVRRWAFKHPTPADFFRTVESVSGEDLAWFWRAFFYGADVLDIGVDGVRMAAADDQPVAVVSLRRVTPVPFPVTMRLKLADGSTQDARLPVQIWGRCAPDRAAPSESARGGACERVDAPVPVRAAVTGLRLWPDPYVPDWDRSNDSWGDAPARDVAGLLGTTGLTTSVGQP